MRSKTWSQDQPVVSVIILCWNNLKLLEECLQSVYDQTYPNYNIVFVDNGSKDGSPEYVEKHHPKVTLVETGANLGFAIGNNIGIKKAFENPDCKYVVLLNTDATLDPDWIEKMVAFSRIHPKLASAQGITVDYFDHAILDSCGILIDHSAVATQIGYRETGVKLKTERVFGANAAAAIYSRAFLEAQPFGDDYLDHDLWMYLEDVDIAARALVMGWENWFVDEVRAYHMGSASSGKNSGFSVYRTRRNNVPVLVKNLPWPIIAKTLPGLIYFDYVNFRNLWRDQNYPLMSKIIKGRLRGLTLVPIFLAKRRTLKRYWAISGEKLWEYMTIPKLKKIPPPYGSEYVAAVVLSRNNIEQLKGCLEALSAEKYDNKRVIVVDDHSTDGSQKFIKANYPKVTLLAHTEDLGTANGFNVGLREALRDESNKPEYFALLRANTRIEHGWLDVMVKTMREREDALAIASKIYLEGPLDEHRGKTINQGYDYHPGFGVRGVEFSGDSEKEVFAASDLASFYRTSKLGMMGAMDSDFFSGLEDVDFCFRVRQLGGRVYSQPLAVAHAWTTHSDPTSAEWYLLQKNLFGIYLKDLPWLLIIKYLPAALFYLLQSCFTAARKGYLRQQIKALLKGVHDIPLILKKRRLVTIHRTERRRDIDRDLGSRIRVRRQPSKVSGLPEHN
jgi:GT2 family glycosyltransferase